MGISQKIIRILIDNIDKNKNLQVIKKKKKIE
jgi:hypothetical protein